MTRSKTDNGGGAQDAKVLLRRNVLGLVKPASVFDAFAGLGKMFESVWHDAASYVGCDERKWSFDEPHRRFVADNRLVLRAIDLHDFNVFDFDAYGSAWEQLIILAARRTWQEGERGAVVITDGTSLKTRFGGLPYAMAELAGLDPHQQAPTTQTSEHLQRFALRGWIARAKVKPLRQWEAEGKGSGRGGAKMRYTALVFEGTG